MNASIREQLLGYLLGALEESEMEVVRRQLEQRPDWREELSRLEDALLPLREEARDVDPPEDLVEQTCELVEVHQAELIGAAATPARTPAGEIYRSRASLADMVVAAGIVVAAALMFFPAISNSRHLARRLECQDNLRQIGLALADYSDKAGAGYFPAVPTSGQRAFAGIYAPLLQEAGYLLDSRVVLCPSSELLRAEQPYRIPTLHEIDSANTARLAELRRSAGGSYGYNLGVVVDGRHQAPRNQGRAHFALAGHAEPLLDARPGVHGGQGQNLLFEDGHVQYLVRPPRAAKLDDPFRNHLGLVAAGIGQDDAVVAPSFQPPF